MALNVWLVRYWVQLVHCGVPLKIAEGAGFPIVLDICQLPPPVTTHWLVAKLPLDHVS